MSIFQKSVLKSFKQNESQIATRWTAYQNFLSKIDFIKTVKEEKYQDGFLKDIFENCLGYTLDSTNPNEFNLEREKKNETDAKKADGVIHVDNKIVGVIELKAQDTKNLDKTETQAFNYHASHSNSKYIIISNFDELRFYIDKKTAYEKFSLFTLGYEEFKKLHLLLSYESIKDDIPLKLKEKSASFEQNISKELYRDFSLFRTHLFENIVKNNDLDKALLLRLTQKLCDRIIFILFAEDRGLLTTNTIKEIRERHSSDGFGDRSMYDYYKLYFDAINTGNDRLNIPKYNGGLFAYDEVLDSLIIDDAHLDMGAQNLSDYDFMSDISVNILGHIFEQSLTDLEEINASINDTEFDSKKSKRKKDGVFYTPEYITKYIVDNTLGKLCNEKREELKLVEITPPKNPKKPTKQEQTQKENLEKYRNWLLNLKILDPACGSGAFLNQALDFLIREHEALQKDLVIMGDITAYYEIEKSILEHNLYGVDINEDAVEIAKLSLWLRTASKGRELTKLADKIKCGNSLIDDKLVAENAFVWEEEFPEVFAQGGFDVVIGNPPYVNIANITNEEHRDFLKKSFKVAKNKSDLYSFFVEKSSNLLSSKGLLGFIVSNSWLALDSFSKFRKFLLEDMTLLKLVKLPKNVFEDATVTANILFIKNEICLNSHNILLIEYLDNEFKEFNHFLSVKDILENHNLTISFNKKIKFRKSIIKLKDIVKFSLGIKTSDDKRFILKKAIDNNCYLMLRGRNISKYTSEQAIEYIWYKPNLMLEKKGAGVRKLEYFFNEKILIQEIAKNISATFDDSDILVNDTVNIIYKIKSDFNLKYILAILNSKLINHWYINTFESGLHVKINQLEQVPIVYSNSQNLFIEKVDLMLELNKKLQETKQNFHDMLNLEKLTKKLQNFEELEFEEFVKEYAKAKKLKFADKLAERNFKQEWQSLFENDKTLTCKLKEEITKTDKEIDEMVYKLYDLTDDEIKIVERGKTKEFI